VPRRAESQEAARRGVDSFLALGTGPVRTCVGCRVRDRKPALLRVVVVDGVLTIDLAGRLPGRGAHVHPDAACIDLADRRRAFIRALRDPGAHDLGPLRSHLQAQEDGPAGL
jgi:predicted RNA-binding protein YlxR (DUF448 family)